MERFSITTNNNFIECPDFNLDKEVSLELALRVSKILKNINSYLPDVTFEELLEVANKLEIKPSSLVRETFMKFGSTVSDWFYPIPSKRLAVREEGAWQNRIKEEYVLGIMCSDYLSTPGGQIIKELILSRFPYLKDDEFMYQAVIEPSEKTVLDLINSMGISKFSPLSEFMEKIKGVDLDSLVKETKVIKSRLSIYYNSNEIYVGTDLGSLYVPIKALIDRNPSLIEERMETYFHDYYRGDKKKLEKALRPMESSQYKYLIDKIKG